MRKALICSMLVVAVVAATAQAAFIKPQIAQDVRGVAMGEYYFQDPSDAETSVELMQGLYINSLRLIFRANGGTSIESWQSVSVCNAARSMVAHNMSTLVLNLLPRGTEWPTTDDARAQFVATYNNLLGMLFHRPNGPADTPGCAMKVLPDGSVVPGLIVQVMPINEPNIVTFCNPGGPDDDNARHIVCADWSARLYHAIYDDIQALEAALGVKIPIIAMGIGSHHDPHGFIGDFCKALTGLGYLDEAPDAVGFHPYPLPGSSDPYSGISMTPGFKGDLKSCFGKPIPVIYTESGFETTVPPNQGYTCTAPPGVLQVSPSQYLVWERTMYRRATSYGVTGIYNFQLFDEQCLNPGWQSGLFTWDGTKKPTWDAMRELEQAAANPEDG